MRALGDLSAKLRRLEAWWSEGLWAADAGARRRGPLAGGLVPVARTLYIVATGFRTERIKLRAALLTYVTLLSLVPALVVMFSVATAFQALFSGVQAALKDFVVESLAVSQQETVMRYLDAFVARAGTLGTAGSAFLLVTTISLLVNIESSFNDVWGLRRGRSITQRFQVYFPLVTLGPLFVGVALSLTPAVEASEAGRRLVALTPAVGYLFGLAPLFLIWVSLTALYVLLPNTRVPFRPAAAGGVVAGSLWAVAKSLFGLYTAHALAVPSVYGPLAAVPLFVLWIYVSWMVVLLGATLTYAIQNARTYEPEALDARRRSQRDRELLAARLVAAVSERFARGAGPSAVGELLEHVVVSPRFVRRVLAELVEARVLVETEGAAQEPSFLPGRPLEAISLADVVRAVRGAGAVHEVKLAEHDALGHRLRQELLETEAHVERELSGTSMAALTAGRAPR